MRPMLATRGTTVPLGPGWQHEVKWDGIRLLAQIDAGRLRLTTRNGNDVTAHYPGLAGLAGLGRGAVLDGEVVGFLDGRQTFAALGDRTDPVTFMAFDLLELDGYELVGQPLSMRRQLLEALELDGPAWKTPPVYDDGQALLQAAVDQGLEGIVSKQLESRYEPGRRSASWLKFAHRESGSYLVGGFRFENGSLTRLGAVLVGEPRRELRSGGFGDAGWGMSYRGRVGSGIAGKQGARLMQALESLVEAESPFADEVPVVDAVGTVWVRPELVVEVASLGLTPARRLRQPAYLGMRVDLSAQDLLDG